MTSIGIIGGGISGLHLGLHLLAQDLSVTIFSNKTAEDIANGPVQNSVAHMHVSREIERELGIDHWRPEDTEYIRHYHYNGWGDERTFMGDFAHPSAVVDYRIMLPQLMRDFEQRGGCLEIREITRDFIERASDDFDLTVVAAGKGEIGAMFPARPEFSPFDAPQRKLAVGFWHGVERRDPNGVEISIAPGVGELLAIPMWTFGGKLMALLFESIPDGPQAVLTDQRYADDPAGYREQVLRVMAEFHPTVYERIDHESFRLQSDQDIMQGALTPILREDFIELPNGKFLLALGDFHMTVDPVQAQGANSGIYSAKVIAETIREDKTFDRRFMEKVARRRGERLQAATEWINTIIGNAAPQVPHLFSAMVHDRALADRFTENFNDPIGQVDLLGSMERVENAIAASPGRAQTAYSQAMPATSARDT